MSINSREFEKWMESLGKSERTVAHYSGAITGFLSEFARSKRIINNSLLNITSSSEFDFVASKIKDEKKFQDKNERGNNMYSCALDRYSEFLRHQEN